MTRATSVSVTRSRRSEQALPLLLLLSFGIGVGIAAFSLFYLRAALVRERGADLARTAVGVADMLDRVLFELFSDIQASAEDSV